MLNRYRKQGFRIVAAFDSDPNVIGTELEGTEVHNLDELVRLSSRLDIRLAILAVPAHAANQVVEKVVEAGIQGILNFAPVTLNLPKSVSSVGVDLAMELEQLAFAVVRTGEKQ